MSTCGKSKRVCNEQMEKGKLCLEIVSSSTDYHDNLQCKVDDIDSR